MNIPKLQTDLAAQVRLSNELIQKSYNDLVTRIYFLGPKRVIKLIAELGDDITTRLRIGDNDALDSVRSYHSLGREAKLQIENCYFAKGMTA